MSEPDPIDPNEPCRRCGHVLTGHSGPGTRCEVELSKGGRVPTLASAGVCPCVSFVRAPLPDYPADSGEPELLDGPAMYAEGLGYLRLARVASAYSTEREMLSKAATYFAAASAAALGEVVAENGTGDLTERRWRAALAGGIELPESPGDGEKATQA